MYYVYILKCDNAFFYVGLTNDLQKRLSQHQKHQSLHTSRYRTTILVHVEKYSRRFDAEAREQQLKGWSSAKKKALIDKDIDLLQKLSKPNPGRVGG